MFFVLSKLLYGFLKPISLIVFSFIVSLVSKNEGLKKKTRIVGVFLLLFFTNPFFSGIAIRLWEPIPKTFSELEYKYNYGIVLTGITDPLKLPNDRVHFNKGADRIIHAIDLYKRGIINKLIISGGSGSLLYPNLSESNALKSVVLMAGIPEKDIVIESKSRNTYENAVNSKELLQKLNSNSKVLLITSAFHMRRASGCFAKANIEFDVFPTDIYNRPLNFTPNELIIPHVNSLKKWTILIKEWIGYIVYATMGYL